MAPSSGSHQIGPANGSFTLRTTKGGVGAKLAHNLVLEAKAWSGTVTYNADDLSASSVQVSVIPSSLEVIDFSGGMKPLSDSDRKEIAKNINDKALKTSKYREITFASTKVTDAGGAQQFRVEGELSITGQTRPVTVDVTLEGGQAVAKATVVQTDFGVKPYSAMLGALKIEDAVAVEVTLTLPA